MPAIAPKLMRLKTLKVECVRLVYQHPKVVSALIHNFPALQELRINSIVFDRFRDSAALIVAHPFPEYLYLDFSWRNELPIAASHWEHEHPDLRPQLRCINLESACYRTIDWISSYYRVLPVHTVTYSPLGLSSLPCIAMLLQIIGSSLQHLTISCYHLVTNSDGMKFPFVETLLSH